MLTLAFDLEKVRLRATHPHVAEVVVPMGPIEFPLKETYENTNGTIEGLRNRDVPDMEKRMLKLVMGAMTMIVEMTGANPRNPN